jgi:hypothetical protein
VADLDKLNERLDERRARQEVGVDTDIPQVLEMKTCGVNIAAAGFMGLFGFGWTSFTAFHAFFMIGGMMKSFGWGALALLGFYAIFFAVGFFMLYAALNAACSENIELNRRELTVRRKLGGWVREKRYTLAPDCEPSIEITASGGENSLPTRSIVLVDTEGRPIHLASTGTEVQRQKTKAKIASYLKAN